MGQREKDSAVAMPFVATRAAISRRRFLRGAGIALSLPLLDSMLPAFASITSRSENSVATTPGGKPRRMFAICNNLGLLPGGFFPSDAGADYTPSNYLKAVQEYRKYVNSPDIGTGRVLLIAFSSGVMFFFALESFWKARKSR